MRLFKITRISHLPIALLPIALLVFSLGQIPASSQSPEVSDPASDPVTEPAPATSPSNRIRPTLTLGSEGDSVSELQAMLKLLGYYSGAVDGVYRASTAAAVSAFQQAVGLQADGIAGPDTWGRLLPPSPPADTTATASEPTTFPSPTIAPGSVPTSSTPSPSPVPPASPTPLPAASPTPVAPAPTEPSPPATPDSPAQPEQRADEQAALVDIDLPILRVGMQGPAVARLQDRLTALGFFNGIIDGIFGSETLAAVQLAQRNYDLEPDGVVGPATWTVLLQQ
ncbi:peptidoglycan-binding protein [Egbenema bharatensis]|uniref:peptidoglycan-binding protein n=1 Tax=Egbenema bharatensis TaxID=3463334 RepID=UPI003A891F1A